MKENFIENGYNSQYITTSSKTFLQVQKNIKVLIAINNIDNPTKENFIKTNKNITTNVTRFIFVIN